MATTNTPDMASAASSDTFALQVLSHSVGVNGVLSFPGLPFTTTVAQLKTKIKDQVAQPNAGERHQRLIHRGRILLKGEETMIDLFGEQTLRDSPTQTLHLALRPRSEDDRPPLQPVPTPIVPQIVPLQPAPAPALRYNPSSALPYLPPNHHLATGPAPQPAASQPIAESPNTNHLPVNLALQAFSELNADIEAFHHANQLCLDCITTLQHAQATTHTLPQREAIRLSVQVALERQHSAWQRAYRTATYNQRQIAAAPAHEVGASELALGEALEIGIRYLEAEHRVASRSPGDPSAPGQPNAAEEREAQWEDYQLTRASALRFIHRQGLAVPEVAHVDTVAAQGDEAARAREEVQRAAAEGAQVRDDVARARETVARARAARVGGDGLPNIGHVQPIRPLAAGLMAQVIPHMWLAMKLLLFVYAFTRMDQSWEQLVVIPLVATVALLYNLGMLEGVWAGIQGHLNGLLHVHDPAAAGEQAREAGNEVVGGQGGQQVGGNEANVDTNAHENAAAAAGAQPTEHNPARGPRPRTRRRRTEPTPEQVAQRIRDLHAQRNRGWLHNALRMVEHDLLLFFTSIVPGVAERHIAAANEARRARNRPANRDWQQQAPVPQPVGNEGVQAMAQPGEGGAQVRPVEAGGSGRTLGGAGNVVGEQEAQQQQEGPRPVAVEYVQDEEAFGGID